MGDDIVDRLRAWASGADEQGVQEVSDGLTFAAAEIERLRQDADENARTLTETRRAVETLTTELEMWRDGNIMAESHRDEIAQLERTAEVTYENHKRIVAELTAQRDKARQMYVNCSIRRRTQLQPPITSRERAKELGWADCFPPEEESR